MSVLAAFICFGAVAFVCNVVSYKAGQSDGMRKARVIVLQYASDCAETAVKYSEDESAVSQTIYWRADGASDALDIVADKLERKT